MIEKIDYVAFGVIIDDIVFPDGKTRMGMLGGGGPQAAFGMRLWSSDVGLVAGIGDDFEPVVLSWLDGSDIDKSGLRVSETPTPRAWQLLEFDERRTQIWRVPNQVIRTQLQRSLEYLPENYRMARGFHYGIHPEDPDLDFMDAIMDRGGLLSIESFKPAERVPPTKTLINLLSRVDIFSANLVEARSLVGEHDAYKCLQTLLNMGPSVAILRLGSKGSWIGARDSDRIFQVPAVPTRVVDPVGAGNAYCGGFLVGWAETQDPVTAGVYGSVAASFLVETIGVPENTPSLIDTSRKRAEMLFQQVNEL